MATFTEITDAVEAEGFLHAELLDTNDDGNYYRLELDGLLVLDYQTQERYPSYSLTLFFAETPDPNDLETAIAGKLLDVFDAITALSGIRVSSVSRNSSSYQAAGSTGDVFYQADFIFYDRSC